jgi:putative ABC transport system permease protein
MSLSFTYALRDLRGNLRAFRIVLACLILGVAATASVLMTGASIIGSINSNGRSILGGDFVVRSLQIAFSDTVITWLEQQNARVSQTIESRVMLANKGLTQSSLVELKAIDKTYPLFGNVALDPSQNLHDALRDNGIVLEPALAQRLQINIGDKVQLGNALFTLRGLITNEPDRAGGSRFGLAPRAMISTDALPATGFLGTGGMMNYDLRVALPTASDMPRLRDAFTSQFPSDSWRITDTNNASPQITNFVNRLMLFLSLVGLSTLLVGGVGIHAGMKTHFESRLRAIAIFKSLGASRNLITKIYLWQAGIIIALGTLIGVVIGISAPFIALPFLQTLLPFPVSPVLSLVSVVVPSLFGILTGFVFALWPLGQAVSTSALVLFRAQVVSLDSRPPRQFIVMMSALALCLMILAVATSHNPLFAGWFLLGSLFCFISFGVMGKMIALLATRVHIDNAPSLRIALRNMGRKNNATTFTLMAMGVGLTVLMTITMIEINLREAITSRLPSDAPAFFFLDIQPDQKDAFVKTLESQPSARAIRLSPNLRGRIVSVNGIPAEQALKDQSESWLLQNDRGFTYTPDLPAHSEITAGQWWPKDYAGPPLISVVDDVERGFGVKVGDQITVNILGRDITATIANIRNVDWTNFTINFAITFAPGTLESAPHSWLGTVVADPAMQNTIQQEITKNFPNVTMIKVSDAITTATTIMGNIGIAVRVAAIISILSGLLVLAATLAATRTARLYDTVILKVLGMRSGLLLRGFFIEFGLLGTLAGGLSLLLGAALSWGVMTHIMDLTWVFYPIPALGTGMAAIVLILIMGWVMTGRVLTSPAAPHLRND